MVHIKKGPLGAFEENILPGLGRIVKILGRIEREIKKTRAVFFEMIKNFL